MREGFQFYLEICMADDGFVGRYEVVEPRRGNRRWPDDVKARIVAESFEPGVRVVDVARRHGVIANQLSDWRRQVRDGILVLPFAAATTSSEHDGIEPAFVPLAIAAESPEPVNRLPLPKLASDGPKVQVLTLQIGSDVVMRVPNDVPIERVAALVRAVRGAS
jgi:transposase